MPQLVHRRLRAPTADGAALIDPPGIPWRQAIEANRSLIANYSAVVGSQSLPALVQSARAELFSAAKNYTGQYRDHISWLTAATHEAPFVLAGHQPELFHPGVWFKNFLLSEISRQCQSVAINLVIDSDLARHAAVRTPVGRGAEIAIENIPIDGGSDALPYEERKIGDARLFESFADRLTHAYRSCPPLGRERLLLVEPLWEAVRSIAGRSGPHTLLGRALAQSRHALEDQYGLRTLEVPLSAAAQTRAMRRFALHLLAELSKFREVYNASLAEFRHVNHIRSHTHPVPKLDADGEWLEAPFFVWTTDNPERRRVFVRLRQSAIALTDRGRLRLELELSDGGAAAMEQLAEAEARGVKLRPRALITTMYARLALSDLFIHGIGGAKYDELTDLIIRRFFGIEPPGFLAATATFRLPIERPHVTAADLRASARRIRELRYRPESFVNDSLASGAAGIGERLAALAADKREYLARHDLRRCSSDVFEGLDLLNRAMHDLLRPVERELRARHAELVQRVKQSQLLGSREFSFVLFPADELPRRLRELCKLPA